MAGVLGPRRMLRLVQARRVGGDALLRGFCTTPVVIALFEAGFFDALLAQGSMDAESFASERGLEPGVLLPMCDYLYAQKLLERNGNRYRLSRQGRLLAGECRGGFEITGAYASVFNNLSALLSGQMRYGVDVQKNIPMTARGSGESGKLFMFPMTIDIIRRRGFKRVLDIGCGDATFLTELCKANADVTGYGVDLSAEAIEDGAENVARARLKGRVHLFAEDMFKLGCLSPHLDSIDAATGFFILHEFLRCGNERVLGFLKMFRETFPGASLLICEGVRHSPEQLRKRYGPLAEFQLSHDLTGQRPLSRSGWKGLFAEAGFRSVREHYYSVVRMAVYEVS